VAAWKRDRHVDGGLPKTSISPITPKAGSVHLKIAIPMSPSSSSAAYRVDALLIRMKWREARTPQLELSFRISDLLSRSHRYQPDDFIERLRKAEPSGMKPRQ
jgi:hypothetical protein